MLYRIDWGTYPFHRMILLYTILHSGAGIEQAVRWIGCGPNHPGLDPFQGNRFLSSKTSRLALGPIEHHIQWEMGALFPEVRQFCREAGHSRPCSVEVNEWNYSSTPLECLHGVCKENFFTIRNSSPLQSIIYFRSSLNIYRWKIKSNRTVLGWHVLCLMKR